MSTFDQTKAYAEQEDVFFDDGREIELLHFVYSKPDIDDIRGNPAKVLAAIDEFGRKKKYLMNVGEDKGRIVTDLIAEVKPKTMVELGGYIGYSTILFGDAVKKAGGKQYFSLERNPEFGAVIGSLIDLAGLSDVVKIEVGSSDASLMRLYQQGLLKHIDMMFLDHYKPAYTTDLKLCEELKLVTPGSVLAADNVIKPGNPPYLKYVRSSVEEKKQAAQQSNGFTAEESGIASRTVNQYTKRGESTELNKSPGNPNLVYDSKLVNSFEPTGVPPKTILVTGVGMTKGLALARIFYSAGHNVIGADFEPSYLPTACGRSSRALKAFHKFTKPDGTKDGQMRYTQDILNVIRKEQVDIWVSCSGVASAVEDGIAKEMVETVTKCKAVQYDVATTKRLHEKHSFMEYTRSIGLPIPDTQTVTSKAAALKFLDDTNGTGKKYIMKYIGTDDSPAKYYWIGHDLGSLVISPLLSLFSQEGPSFVEVFESLLTFVEHVLWWRDGTFEIWDPLPAWWLYHIYWPYQFVKVALSGQKWSRINVSTCKMFTC
ncbi:hypothetical protein BTJ68_10976 [Hortaea werneckii EXF-2000]|uniref:catechol O-methyltransferase n=1 Tax=Hortaea werneckii EXF-2000 TaxID=1157616 RepID=A0A1Z5SXI3_HORWE|nr:hypothetical protein BTJ68_10976 [Hortaea werneckii EXF-2000]